MPKDKIEYETVPQAQINAAYDHFVATYFPGHKGMGLYFWHFLGMTVSPLPPDANNWIVPKEVAQRIRMMAGPHFRTIAKIIESRGRNPSYRTINLKDMHKDEE